MNDIPIFDEIVPSEGFSYIPETEAEDRELTLPEFLDAFEDCKVISDVKMGRNRFTYVLLHSSGCHIFIKGEKCDVFEIQTVLNLPKGKLHIYLESEDGWKYLAPWTDEWVSAPDIQECVSEAVGCGMKFLDERQTDILSDKLGLSSKKRSFTMSTGETLTAHNGTWKRLSDEDTEEVFDKAFKFGWFGWYQYHKGKKVSAVFYALTLGMFGVGYFMDMVSFCLGSAKDADGAYYAPLKDKKKMLIKLGLSAVIGTALLFAYYFIVLYLNEGIARLFSSLLS